MRCTRTWLPQLVAVLLICIGMLGCIPLYTASTISPGSIRLSTVTGWGAPPVYIDGLHLTYGLASKTDVTMNVSVLSGALDEPGADLELRTQLLRQNIDLSVAGGMGRYLVDGGLYATVTAAASTEYRHFSPFLIHRLEVDRFVRPRGKLYAGVELFPQRSFRLAAALGSRDVYHRDLFTLAVGMNVYFKGFSRGEK